MPESQFWGDGARIQRSWLPSSTEFKALSQIKTMRSPHRTLSMSLSPWCLCLCGDRGLREVSSGLAHPLSTELSRETASWVLILSWCVLWLWLASLLPFQGTQLVPEAEFTSHGLPSFFFSCYFLTRAPELTCLQVDFFSLSIHSNLLVRVFFISYCTFPVQASVWCA